MATKKTSIFTLTERVTISAASTTVSETIDLASYVDVGDRQAIQVHSIDYIVQGTTANGPLESSFTADTEVICQVTDLNRGGMVFANDRALISSMNLTCDNAGGRYMAADLYPDNFGKGSDDGRYVVNDQLYIDARSSSMASNQAVNITVRVNASIVTLSSKDFMAIAIQSTAADN